MARGDGVSVDMHLLLISAPVGPCKLHTVYIPVSHRENAQHTVRCIYNIKSNIIEMSSGSTSAIGTHCDLEAEAAAAAAQRTQRRLEPLERATCLQRRQPG